MLNGIAAEFAVSEKALALRGYRQQLLASNIANADTPNYKAMDIDFDKALKMAGAGGGDLAMARTSARHLDGGNSGSVLAGLKPQYRNAVQPSIDGNTVDVNIEQAQFAENALQYTTTLQFMNDRIKTMKMALERG